MPRTKNVTQTEQQKKREQPKRTAKKQQTQKPPSLKAGVLPATEQQKRATKGVKKGATNGSTKGATEATHHFSCKIYPKLNEVQLKSLSEEQREMAMKLQKR
jgi:phage tail tape-measure protein